MLRLDAHLHVFAKVSAEFPRHSDQTMPADSEAPVEVLLQEMEEHGVGQAVLVQIGGAELDQHAYLRHCLKAHPERFRGIGLIPTDCSDPAAHMDRLAADGDLIGFRLFDLGGPFDPLAPLDIRTTATYPIWQRAEELGASFLFYGPADKLPAVEPIIARFPNVKVALDHNGSAPPNEEDPRPLRKIVLDLAKYDNVYIKLSPQGHRSNEEYPYPDTFELYQSLLETYGAQRLMWGTNFPGVLNDLGYVRALEMFRMHMDFFSDEDKEWIFSKAALSIYNFGE